MFEQMTAEELSWLFIGVVALLIVGYYLLKATEKKKLRRYIKKEETNARVSIGVLGGYELKDEGIRVKSYLSRMELIAGFVETNVESALRLALEDYKAIIREANRDLESFRE